MSMKANKLSEYDSDTVSRTLRSNYCPPLIAKAREAQDRIVTELFHGKKVRIADIGCGDGYHGELFAPACEAYHGFEISRVMANSARKRWHKLQLNNARVVLGNAAAADLREQTYDVAWCLYFTPGNLRDEFDDIRNYDDEYLNKNPCFIAVIGNFFGALRPGGQLFLTVYMDVVEAERAQREFYENTGQHVVTPIGSRFVATKENFWSVRWTTESLYSNLTECGIENSQVQLISLNEISWLVKITKQC